MCHWDGNTVSDHDTNCDGLYYSSSWPFKMCFQCKTEWKYLVQLKWPLSGAQFNPHCNLSHITKKGMSRLASRHANMTNKRETTANNDEPRNGTVCWHFSVTCLSVFLCVFPPVRPSVHRVGRARPHPCVQRQRGGHAPRHSGPHHWRRLHRPRARWGPCQKWVAALIVWEACKRSISLFIGAKG